MYEERKVIRKTPLGFEENTVIRGVANRRIQNCHVAELEKRPQDLRVAGTKLAGQQLIRRNIV